MATAVEFRAQEHFDAFFRHRLCCETWAVTHGVLLARFVRAIRPLSFVRFLLSQQLLNGPALAVGRLGIRESSLEESDVLVVDVPFQAVPPACSGGVMSRSVA
jgi:hypothetical protein